MKHKKSDGARMHNSIFKGDEIRQRAHPVTCTPHLTSSQCYYSRYFEAPGKAGRTPRCCCRQARLIGYRLADLAARFISHILPHLTSSFVSAQVRANDDDNDIVQLLLALTFTR